MSGLLGASPLLIAGLTGCLAAVAVLTYLALSPRPLRLPAERRRPDVVEGPSALTAATQATSSAIGRVLHRREKAAPLAAALEGAGLTTRPQDFVLMVGAAALVAAAAGLLLAGPLLALAAAVPVPLLAKVYLSVRNQQRQKTFADQLDDSLQLLSSSLRAGHSLPQALNSVAKEAESPTAEEFSRVINEMRVGRPITQALEEVGARMRSEDFVWVTQAIGINREVGGNLADVLDGIGHTIRERNQVRRQVKALSAEGKLSAIVLVVMPFCIMALLALLNPSYVGKLVEGPIGWLMTGTAAVLMIIGGLWLRKTVALKF
jgi:tight adherence protein B